jgi:polysaccharide export outer membrane protein
LAGGTRAGADSESVEVWRFVSPSESRALILPLRADPLIEPDDRIYVRRVADWHRGATVQVVGEAVRPGAYAISPAGERATDLIARFGGFTRYADLGGVAVYRAGLVPTRDSAYVTTLRAGGVDAAAEDAQFLRTRSQAQGTLSIRFRKLVVDRDRSADFDLRDGDVVSIPIRTGSVAIYGAVKRPGAVPYRPGADLQDYIRDAGGYGKRADRGKIRVTKAASGQPVRAQDVASVEEGDLVWVPERGHTSFIKAVGNVTGFVAQIATIYLVIHQATK